MATAAQKVLADRYVLRGMLGEGAMSTVHCAEDRLLARKVAVKILRPGFADDDLFVKRFYLEARAAAQIVDAHVVAIHDILSEGDTHAIVMEYVDGNSLAQRLRNGPISEREAIDYARQCAQALRAAHEHGVLHRDVKPANLLLRADGVVKVADFGLAKAANPADVTLVQPGQMVGSVHYFSPEQAQGKPLGPASDLYSLGIVLYQMISGAVPFTGESPVSVALAQVCDPEPSMEQLTAIMSPGLAAIVHRLLEKDAAKRYQSASELDWALAGVQSAASCGALDAPTIVTPISSPPTPSRKPVGSPAAGAFASFIAWSEYYSREVLEPTMARASGSAGQAWHEFTGRLRTPRSARLPVGAPLLLAGALLVGLFGLAVFALAKPAVALSDYRHQPARQAEARLSQAGLYARPRLVPSQTAPAGTVIAQDPAPRATVHKGDVVQLTVSSGLPTVAMPNLTGHPLVEAARTLYALKLAPRFAAKVSQAPANTVIEEVPAPGTAVREHGRPLVIISAGPQPRILYTTSGAGGGDGGD